ncbi:hypothetical protein LTR60_004832, partial [Cryomyces antarcticus]
PEIYAYLQSRTSPSPAGLLTARHATPSYPLTTSDDRDKTAEITSYVAAYLASHLPSVQHNNDNNNANRARHNVRPRSHRRAAADARAFPAALDSRSQLMDRRAKRGFGEGDVSLAAKVRAFIASWTSENEGAAAGGKREAEGLIGRRVGVGEGEEEVPVLRPRGMRHWTA